MKESSFSPARPRRAETRLFPCFILGSSKSSMGTRPPHHSAARTDVVLLVRRTVRPRGYVSGFDLPAALLDGLFEQSANVEFILLLRFPFSPRPRLRDCSIIRLIA